ncbi:membrane protein [Megasphaera cerevisiae DSM 20462]|uniref:Membrane protein n=1 Tax=Megasphaera cerevisiae DSM 20462 TaxID=1122219 RepID=A0A0J6WTD8_9FIRM|nr:ECF transporter S component [Megasphaera cerevisiae]KMO86800.1 membrane protein [Megasphaera cerevisiae DSM 20462]MCI1750713.1 ECF transporter S component [Megasphaera cerevisiae]OKY54495.1 hypothetical protein BSR42_02450 [Megasphaera cerevisiae]SJZ35608.1 Uncharacterized membrane protein [Megasphaera cerevisiae DSM 20462]
MNTCRLDGQQPVSAKAICTAAVLAALVFVMTFVPRIPIPLGYAHLGDAVIYLTVLFAGRRESALAASVGSAAADFIGGFPIWIVPTLIIKYIMVEIVFWVIRPDIQQWKLLSGRTFLAFFLSSLWMVCSYTAAGAVLYGSTAAGLTMVPGLVGEGGINMTAAFGAGMLLKGLKFKR